MIDVRLELGERLHTTTETVDGKNLISMEVVASIAVWRLDPPERRITSRTKPDAVLVGATRAEVLRDLADWIEAGDGDLVKLVDKMAEAT